MDSFAVSFALGSEFAGSVDFSELGLGVAFLPGDRCQGSCWQVPSIVGYCPRGARNPRAVQQRCVFGTAVLTWGFSGLVAKTWDAGGRCATPAVRATNS